MEEKKPGTGLVVLPSLQLIPLETLPKRRSEELVSLKKARAEALGKARGSMGLSVGFGLYASLFGAIVIAAFPYAPLWLVSVFIIIFTGSAVISGHFFGEFLRDMLKCRQMPLTPQLCTDAEAETMLFDAARETNAQIAEWNAAAQKATEHDLGGRYMRSLKQYRTDLSIRTEKIKQLAKRIGVK